MITLTETEATVYNTYIQYGTIQKTAEILKRDFNTISKMCRQLVGRGLLERTCKNGRYLPTNKPFNVMSYKEYQANVRKRQFPITMTDAEVEWMKTHYKKHRKNREYVAKELGRSRLEVNFMAMALGLDQKDGADHAKSNQSCSA